MKILKKGKYKIKRNKNCVIKKKLKITHKTKNSKIYKTEIVMLNI